MDDRLSSPHLADPDHDLHDRVVVSITDDAYCVLAREAIAAGEPIMAIRGTITRAQTRYSLQIDHDTHIVAGDEDAMNPKQMTATDPWRFTNHGCVPNAMVVGRYFVAIHDIAENEEVVFNYNTTELSMTEPFQCHCGSLDCLRTIAGFRHLTVDQREHLRPWLAPHIEKWLEDSGK